MSSIQAEPRRYGGASAAERVAERRARLLAAALDLMGAGGTAAVTVRGVAEASGLGARYVYESFPAIEDLQLAVFDEIALEAATRAIAALLAVSDAEGREARTRAVLAEMADLMLEDPRKGRIVLLEAVSSPVLGPRVRTESRRFAAMLAATASAGDPLAVAEEPSPRLGILAQFLIGGVAHALAAVLEGDVQNVTRDEVVDTLVDVFAAVDGLVLRETGVP